MSAPQFDLTGAGVWEFLYDESREAQQPAPGQYIPIPRVTLPILLQEKVIVIGTSSTKVRPNWKSAGTVTQRLLIPSLGVGVVDGFRQNLRVNALTLVVFPQLTPDYQLDIDVHPWIRDLDISIWRYIGPEQNDIIELIQTLKIDVLRVEAKVDQLP